MAFHDWILFYNSNDFFLDLKLVLKGLHLLEYSVCGAFIATFILASFQDRIHNTYRLLSKDDRKRKILETLSFFFFSLSLSLGFASYCRSLQCCSYQSLRLVMYLQIAYYFFFLRSLATRLHCRSWKRSLRNDMPRASKSYPCWRYRYMKRVASEYRIYDLTYIYPLAISWPTKSMDTRLDESNSSSSRSSSSSVALTSRNTRALA